MTKLEYLQQQSLENRRSIWYILGKNTININSKYFAEGSIYKIDIPNTIEVEGVQTPCPLNNALIFCKKELILQSNKKLDWMSFREINRNDYNKTSETTFGNNIISPYFEVILRADLFNQMEEHPDEYPLDLNIVPFQFDNQNAVGEVKICDKDYENCLKCLGYPFISEDDLEYSKKDILNLAIKPALEEYFHWLPLEEITEEPVTGQVQLIEFPKNAYDVLGVSVQQRGTHGSGNITNTLLRYFDEAAYGSYNYAGMTGTYRGTLRPHTISSPVNNFISTRALAQATTNLNTRVHFEKVKQMDEKDGIWKDYVKVFSNKLGAFNIHWAIQSLNFDDVEYQQRQNVFKYCQAEIMLLFANLRRQAKSDIPGAVDYSGWITEANTMKQEVVADWKQLVKASGIIRGSL